MTGYRVWRRPGAAVAPGVCGPRAIGLCFLTMHPWRTIIALILLAPCVVAAGTVYKWVDADGVVHYSDQPQDGAEKVQLGTVQSLAMPVARGAAAQPKPREEPKKAPLGLGYTAMKITSPTAGRTFVNEPVPVSLDLTPQLQPGHTVTWYLNEAPLGETETSFTLDRLDRGTYTLYASITDATGAETVNSPVVTFNVHQPSMLAPQNPRH